MRKLKLLETTVLIRLTDHGFAVTTKAPGQPDTVLEYETTAAEPVDVRSPGQPD